MCQRGPVARPDSLDYRLARQSGDELPGAGAPIRKGQRTCANLVYRSVAMARNGPSLRSFEGVMGRGLASRRRRLLAVIGVCAVLATAPSGAAAKASDHDANCACGDCVSGDCANGGDGGLLGELRADDCACDGACFCGLLVTAAGGCASGDETAWVRADYILWHRDGVDLPPLVTASPAGTPPAEQGIIGFARHVDPCRQRDGERRLGGAAGRLRRGFGSTRAPVGRWRPTISTAAATATGSWWARTTAALSRGRSSIPRGCAGRESRRLS